MGNAPLDGTQSVAVSDDLVSALLKDQAPQYSHYEIGRHYDVGDHVAVRLGDDYVLALPTVAAVSDEFDRVGDWIERITKRFTFAVSTPVVSGSPTNDYPFNWVIAKWIAASTAAVVPLSPESAGAFAKAIYQLHQPSPRDAPESTITSRPLADHFDEWSQLALRAADALGPFGERIDVPAFTAVWEAGAKLPVDIPPHWTHGALSPLTVLSDRGTFAGICDWHTLGAGDPAVDNAAASMLLPAEASSIGAEVFSHLTDATRGRIFAYRQLFMLRYALSDNPFMSRYGWSRIGDRHLVKRPRAESLLYPKASVRTKAS